MANCNPSSQMPFGLRRCKPNIHDGFRRVGEMSQELPPAPAPNPSDYSDSPGCSVAPAAALLCAVCIGVAIHRSGPVDTMTITVGRGAVERGELPGPSKDKLGIFCDKYGALASSMSKAYLLPRDFILADAYLCTGGKTPTNNDFFLVGKIEKSPWSSFKRHCDFLNEKLPNPCGDDAFCYLDRLIESGYITSKNGAKARQIITSIQNLP